MIKARCGCGATCEISYRDNQYGEEREKEVIIGWLAAHKCVRPVAPEDIVGGTTIYTNKSFTYHPETKEIVDND